MFGQWNPLFDLMTSERKRSHRLVRSCLQRVRLVAASQGFGAAHAAELKSSHQLVSAVDKCILFVQDDL